MKCNRCNQIIPDDSEFCHLCGNKISKDIPPVSAVPDPEEKVEKVKKAKQPMAKKTRKAIMLSLVSVLSLAVIAILVVCFIIPLGNYNHAQELLELGKYDLAYSAFSELGDYSDSRDKLIETRYLQAVDYRNKGDFDVANKIFESLGDYKDSKVLIHIHNYTVSDSVAPSCTSKGRETTTCYGCGNSNTRIIEATAHDYVLSKQTKPTCVAAGEDTYTCSGCNASYTKAVQMVSHNYVLSKQKKATCVATGESTYTCSGCGDSYKNSVAMVSHNYVLSKQTAASCSSTGEKRYSCSMCGNSYTEKIEQTAHSWKNATCSNPKTCSTCGRTEGSALGHSNDVVCTRCGVTTFKTLSYSGTGSKTIDFSLPKGKFKVTVTKISGGYTVDAKVHYTGSYGDTYEWFYIPTAGESEVEIINGPTPGTIVVNAGSSSAGSSWKVSIAAISN